MMLLANARHQGSQIDLLWDGGKILTMTPAGHCPAPDNAEIFDATDLVLLPGFIDAHTHLREPGFEYKEDIASGLTAAAHGGFSAVMCMANTKPVNDTAAVTKFILNRAVESHPFGPRLYPIAAATKGLKGEEMAPLEELKEAGCVALSNDGRPLTNTELLRRIMEYAADLDMILIDHCEDPHLANGWLMNEGPVSGLLGVKGQPDVGEAIQAARDIMLAEYLGLPVHIAHVSAKLTLDVIAWGKTRGVKVSAETCPHYLLLDDRSLDGYNTLAKVSPPLRGIKDQEALRQAVKSGLIDILTTDHAPHATQEKDCTLDQAMYGFTGLDTALSLSWELVRKNILDESDLIRLWCKRPGEIFKLPWNGFAPGDPANFFLFDPNVTWIPNSNTMFSKSCNTPFLGQPLQGRVKAHWIEGRRIL